MGDMSDEFKIDILRSVKNLVRSAPKRSKTVLYFLGNILKSEGNYELKKYYVSGSFWISLQIVFQIRTFLF